MHSLTFACAFSLPIAIGAKGVLPPPRQSKAAHRERSMTFGFVDVSYFTKKFSVV